MDQEGEGISASQRQAWCKALSEANCKALKDLFTESPQLAWQGWRDDPDTFPIGRTALHVGAMRGCPELVYRVLKEVCRGRASSIEQESKVKALLVAKDPEYELDALEIAASTGNWEVISDLAKASTNNTSSKGKRKPYTTAIDKEFKRVLQERADETSLRAQIRMITEEVMRYLTGPDATLLQTEYNNDVHLNFLPWQEYLFHFTFGRPTAVLSPYEDPGPDDFLDKLLKEVRHQIYDRAGDILLDASSSSPHLVQDFLLELKDGRGRTALHAAIEIRDSKRVREFLYLLHEEPTQKRTRRSKTRKGRHRGQNDSQLLEGGERWHNIYERLDTMQLEMLEIDVESATTSGGEGSQQRRKRSGLRLLDGIGRTALHWAAALGNQDSLRALLHYGTTAALINAEFDRSSYEKRAPVGDYGRQLELHQYNEGCHVTALHLAILHKHVKCVEVLLDPWVSGKKEKNDSHGADDPKLDLKAKVFEKVFDDPITGERSNAIKGEALQLATIVGEAEIVRLLLDGGAQATSPNPTHFLRRAPIAPVALYSAFHIAAGFGDFVLLRELLDHQRVDPNHDPFAKDRNGNNALDHVMLSFDPDYEGHKIALLGKPCLLDCVSVDHFQQRSLSSKGRVHRVELSNSVLNTRQECVEILLQAGFDPWEPNREKKSRYSMRETPLEFLAWWYNKQAATTTGERESLKGTANAISVTAALVATSSFVGPLQPPLGYLSSGEGLNLAYPSIRIFIVTDSLSLFLALASIMIALIPSLPLPRQSSAEVKWAELKRTRRLVNFAVGLLIPSIVLLLIAFAQASAAVVPPPGEHKRYGGITFPIVVIGGAVGVIISCIVSMRVLVLVDKSRKLRKLYDIGFFRYFT